MSWVKNPVFTVGKAHVQRGKGILPMSHDWQKAELDEDAFIIIYWTKNLKPITKSTNTSFMKTKSNIR